MKKMSFLEMRVPNKITEKGIVWLLILVSFIYYLTYFNFGIDLDDEGFLLGNASSILEGQWPMADFFSYQPLSYFLLGLFYKIFGNNVFSERLMLMGLILFNVWLIFYCAIKLLPLRWAWQPAAVYAFAPGPWYKVFFISHMLLSLAATVYFLNRPNGRRAFVIGLSCGLAAISRIEAASLITIVVSGFLFLVAWRSDSSVQRARAVFPEWLKKGTCYESAFFGGLLLILLLTLGGYWAAGKLPRLIENTLHYYNYADNVTYVNDKSGIASVFSIRKLITAPSMEIAVYAFAMSVCIFNLLWFGKMLIQNKTGGRVALLGISIAIFGVASLGYTYYYVWNSRMLSTFAVVYINYFALLALIHQSLSVHPRMKQFALASVVVGAMLLTFYLYDFIKVQNYSGSFTTKIKGMVQVNHPKLKGIYVYPEQGQTIADLMRLTNSASPVEDYLVSMSESTTLSYLSGLPNPTYYRSFLMEFAHYGEEERAIQQFELHKVRYFVARRSQFLDDGPKLGSDLAAYAPRIRAYLLAKYQITPLGPGFVLLERKGG